MKNFRYLVPMLGLIFWLGGCAGPVSKVLRDPVKFGVVRDSVFARGLCLNDTVITTVRQDSVVYRDTTITKVVRVQTPAICRVDTLVNGQRIVLADGLLTVTNTTPCRDRFRTLTRTQTVRDVSKENVLIKLLQTSRVSEQRSETALKLAQSTLSTRFWQLLLVLGLLGVSTYVAVKKTFLF